MTEQEKKEKNEENEDKKVKELEDIISKKEEEIKELKDKYMRALAQFQNFKKRYEKEKFDIKEEGKIEVIVEILSSIDNFERALDSIGENGDLKSLKDGVELVFKKLIKDLSKLGVKKIEALNKEFDPNYHYAIDRRKVENIKQDNKVIEVMQPGYIFKDKVIRPAIVVVGKYEKEEEKK